MKMEGMNHADRENFPYFGCSDCDLLVDANEIVGFSIDAHDVAHLHLGFLIEPRAHAAIQDELTALHCLVRVGGRRGSKMRRQILNRSNRRGRLEAHDGLMIALDAPFHHPAEYTEFLIRAGFERNRLAVGKVNEDFKAFTGRYPKLSHRHRRSKVSAIGCDDMENALVIEAQIEVSCICRI